MSKLKKFLSPKLIFLFSLFITAVLPAKFFKEINPRHAAKTSLLALSFWAANYKVSSVIEGIKDMVAAETAASGITIADFIENCCSVDDQEKEIPFIENRSRFTKKLNSLLKSSLGLEVLRGCFGLRFNELVLAILSDLCMDYINVNYHKLSELSLNPPSLAEGVSQSEFVNNFLIVRKIIKWISSPLLKDVGGLGYVFASPLLETITETGSTQADNKFWNVFLPKLVNGLIWPVFVGGISDSAQSRESFRLKRLAALAVCLDRFYWVKNPKTAIVGIDGAKTLKHALQQAASAMALVYDDKSVDFQKQNAVAKLSKRLINHLVGTVVIEGLVKYLSQRMAVEIN